MTMMEETAEAGVRAGMIAKTLERMLNELDEPLRTPALSALEALVSTSAILGYGIERLGEELVGSFPLTLDELTSGDTPLTNEEIGQEIQTLALELRAVKEEVAVLHQILYGFACTLAGGLPEVTA
jgi:hypothetical protein